MWKSLIFLLCLGLVATSATFAETITSGQFTIENPSTVTPNNSITTSPSFSLDANVSGVVSSGGTSTSFTVTSAATQAGATTPTPSPSPTPSPTPSPSGGGGVSGGGGGGGGGGGATPAVGTVTITNNLSCPIYRQVYRIQGTKSIDISGVKVNGSTTNVEYPSATSWYKVETFGLGSNTITLQGLVGTREGDAFSVSLKRHFPGDVNGDREVNDFDLSLLASHWGQVWCQADFNSDGVIDDFDLSLLVSAWGSR